MDRERWIKAGLEIGEHLKEIRRIINQNGIDQLSMTSFSNRSWGTYIDDEKHWEVNVDADGTIGLEENFFRFYTKI